MFSMFIPLTVYKLVERCYLQVAELSSKFNDCEKKFYINVTIQF
jgi:hypothetical protein